MLMVLAESTFGWGAPGEMLSDHQHGSSAGRIKMLPVRENLFHAKAREQPHPCRGTAEQMTSEWQGPESKAGKRQNYSPPRFPQMLQLSGAGEGQPEASLMPKGSSGNCEGHQMNQLSVPSPKACLLLGKIYMHFLH